MKNRSQFILAFVSITLLASNLLLIYQNIQLRSQLEQSKQFVIEEGYKLSELNVRDLDGNEENIDLSDSEFKTLLLIFNSSCQYCIQQYPYWNELIANVDSAHWRIIAVSSETDYDKIKKHIEDHKIRNIKIVTIPLADMRKSRLMYTPMTVAVEANGEVKKVWAGLWTKKFDLPN